MPIPTRAYLPLARLYARRRRHSAPNGPYRVYTTGLPTPRIALHLPGASPNHPLRIQRVVSPSCAHCVRHGGQTVQRLSLRFTRLTRVHLDTNSK